jgi:glycosyltransferase involved in cell wall biosynthesis
VINQKTQSDFEKLYEMYGIDQSFTKRIICIPNFTEARSMPAKDYNRPLKMLYAGRGGEEKRVHLLAKLASEFKRQVPAAEFHFAGDVKHAVPAKYLKDCILHGNITDPAEMEKIYAGAHVLLIASSREGFPMVIMEGMMQGVVPVSTDVGGIAEHVHHGENGLLVKATGETEILKEMKDHLLNLDRSRTGLQKLSNAAHAYALRTFSRDHFFNAYFKLLNNEQQ